MRAARSRRLEDLECPPDIHLGVVLRPLDRCVHVGLGGEVADELRTHLVEQSRRVGSDVADVQLRALRQLLAAARHERVEHVHLVAAGDQRLGDVRADEARSPGDDRPQGSVS